MQQVDEMNHRLVIRLAHLLGNGQIDFIDAFGAAEVAQSLRGLRSAQNGATFPNPQTVNWSGYFAAVGWTSVNPNQRRREQQQQRAHSARARQAGKWLTL